MPTPAAERGVVPAARQLVDQASKLVRLELELASIELKRKVALLGAGVGLVAGAALLALYALGFGLLAAAAGLATVFSVWLALLIVTAGLVVIAAILAYVGTRILRKGVPPVPEEAILEARQTAEMLGRDGRS